MILRFAVINILFVLPWTINADDETSVSIPAGFKIGVAGSAYQTEGAWNVSDKGLSNWDFFTHEKSDSTIDQSNGDISCDSYHKYKEDIQIVKKTGFDHYRISLSWPRILPTGLSNNMSEVGIQYYKNVLDELRSEGIEPFVTIYHWDHPHVFDDTQGWLNESIVDHFADYARTVFTELGSRVKFWTTINEPIAYCNHAYGTGYFAPGLKDPGKGPYICGQNMLKAHAKAFHIYDEYFRSSQHGIIGIVNSCLHFYSIDENDSESPDTAFQYNCGWLSHPIFSEYGDYPGIMKQRINENSKLEGLDKSRLPELTPDWIELIKGSSDYFGLNYYTSRMTKNVPKSNATGWFEDLGVMISENANWPFDTASWLRIVPEGLRGILRKIKSEYNNPDVFILENGIATNGSLLDLQRINYLFNHMKEMFLAINQDGCSVKAYTVRSLLDNFEWVAGYKQPYGIVRVDFSDPNRKRTLRQSAHWLSDVLNSRKLVKFDGSSSFNASRR